MIFFKITIAVFVSAIMLTACEKDAIQPNDKMASQKSQNNKSINHQLKSLDEFPPDYWDGLEGFTLNIIENAPFAVNIEIEKALFYIEAALDYQLTYVRESNVQTRVAKETTFAFDIMDGQVDFTDSEIRNLYGTIFNEIVNEAVDLHFSENDTIAIEAIDLEWEINSDYIEVHSKVLYSVGQIAPIYCILDHRQAGNRLDCYGNPASATAAELIDQKTRPLSCGTWDRTLSCGLTGFTVNTNQSSLDGTKCSYTFYDGPMNNCRNYATNNYDHDEVQKLWNDQCHDITNNTGKLTTVHFAGRQYGTYIEFNATYWTGGCFPTSNNLPVRNMPSWSGNPISL